MALKKIRVIAILFLALISIGCSGDGTFERPDVFEVTTPEAVHGQVGYRADVMVAEEGEALARQLVLVLQDSDVSGRPIYVVMGYTSGAPHSTNQNTLDAVELIDYLHASVSVDLVPSLPKGITQKGGITYGGNTFLCYLQVTTPSETLYWSVRSSPETMDGVLTWLATPPKVLDTGPATVTEISYYSDPDLTIPIVDSVLVGDTIYTKVVFSKDVPIVFADDDRARPVIASSVSRIRYLASLPYFSEHQPKEFQYRIKPPGTSNEHLQSGDAKPYQNTRHTFICKYAVPREDMGEVFYTYVGRYESAGSQLRIRFFNHLDHTNELSEHVGETITDWQPNDFVGQVYIPSIEDGISVHFKKRLPGANVTIVSGVRSGESTITDKNGRYRFLNVNEDELHLRVEKAYFEPKEVIAHRSGPTILSNGATPVHRTGDDPQRVPGNILVGFAWPSEVRLILEEMLVPPDLLYCEGSVPPQGYQHVGGFYHFNEGVVVVYSDGYWLHSEARTDWLSLLSTFAHEFTHAHQHMVTIDSGVGFFRWVDTPEGKAFQAAREKDMAEVGEAWYDYVPLFSTSALENAAETGAHYWSKVIGNEITREEHFPNRFKWAEEWLRKK